MRTKTGNYEYLYDKYAYVIERPWTVYLLYIIGLIAWGMTAYGYILFFQIEPLYAYILGPIILIYSLYYGINYGLNFFYKKFDKRKHTAYIDNYWKSRTEENSPSVDIFVTVCGEDPSVVEKTLRSVARIEYAKKTVYLLDDLEEDHNKVFAEELGFVYLSRENKGHMKKAGNIKHGYENSSGEFIVIFDADFAPHHDFIRDLLPYTSDPRTAIVQSPQYFQTDKDVHKRSIIEYGAGQVQEDFYRIIQQSRDTFGAAICVGSNAIYRRSAIEDIGGPVLVDHSEDVLMGFRILNRKWKIKYIPLILAVGLCPEELHSYFHQQMRWCNGSMMLLFSREFWKSKLTFMQKLCFHAGFLYYITHAIEIFLSFQLFILIFLYPGYLNFDNSLPFIPYILFIFIIAPGFRVSEQRLGSYITRYSHNYSYTYSIFTTLLGKVGAWHPTHSRKSRVSDMYKHMISVATLYIIVYVLLLSIGVWHYDFSPFRFDNASVTFWLVYTIVMYSLHLWHAYDTLFEIETRETKRKERVGGIDKHTGVFLAVMFGLVIIFLLPAFF